MRHTRTAFPQNAYRANNNHIEILGVLLTETMLITTENPGSLPLRFRIRQTHAESGIGRIWDHDTSMARCGHRRTFE